MQAEKHRCALPNVPHQASGCGSVRRAAERSKARPTGPPSASDACGAQHMSSPAHNPYRGGMQAEKHCSLVLNAAIQRPLAIPRRPVALQSSWFRLSGCGDGGSGSHSLSLEVSGSWLKDVTPVAAGRQLCVAPTQTSMLARLSSTSITRLTCPLVVQHAQPFAHRPNAASSYLSQLGEL